VVVGMGNQYSDASGGDLVNQAQEGAGGVPRPPAPGDGAGFQPSHEASVPLPVGGGGGGSGSQMRDSEPLIGTPDELDSVPFAFGPRSGPNDDGHGVLKTGTVHTRTNSFDAGDHSALSLPHSSHHARPLVSFHRGCGCAGSSPVYKLARLSLEQEDAMAAAGDEGSPRRRLSPPRVMANPEVKEPPPLQPVEPATVPCVVTWKHPGQNVFLTGDFNAWTQDSPMMRDGNEFWQVLNLIPGRTYHYKFVVDGEWMYAPDHSTARDARGNMSNYIQVDHWEPNVENDVLTVESPRGSYARELPLDEDQYAKEPPPVPAHLMSKQASPGYMNDFAVAYGGAPDAVPPPATSGLLAGGAAGPPPVGGAAGLAETMPGGGGGGGGGGGDGGAPDGAASAGGMVAEVTPGFVSKDLVADVSRALSRSFCMQALPCALAEHCS
jgi:hypothetical protein